MALGDTTAASDVPGRFRLDDQVAIITGAGRGIGAAMARAFATAGADVALVARTREQLDEVAAAIRTAGRRALVLPADVSDIAGLAGLIDATVEEFGGLDIVVNNAGGSVSHPFLDERVEHLEASFRFNVSATFELSRLAVPHLLTRGGGSILNISSVAGRNASRASLVHGTTKAAVSHMTRLMAADLAPKVRVNAILPGAIETEALKWWLSTLPGDVRTTMAERTLMRRNGTPDDIAAAALYLVSPAAAWVTGKLLDIDGGAPPDLVPKDIADL